MREVSRAGQALELTRATLGYGAEAVIENATFVLERGQSLALVGTNGSGKSTLLKTVLGLLSPMSGSVLALGSAPGSQPANVAYLGQTLQSSPIAPVRALDVVWMGRYASLGLRGRRSARDRALVDHAIEHFAVGGFADLPLRALSGGQRQRVHLARVMAHGGELLVLDEPTSGLDLVGIDRYRTLIAEARASGTSVVTATHDIAEAAAYDRVLLLDRRIVAFGPPSEVLTTDRLLETFGVALSGIPHGDHHDLVLSEHGHDHAGHDHAGHEH